MLLALVFSAHSAQTLTGDYIQATYDDNGAWNDYYGGLGEGLEYDSTGSGASFCDFTYPGTPWAHVVFAFDQGGSNSEYYANSYYGETLTVVSESDDSTASQLVSTYEWTAGDLEVTKIEIWDVTGSVMSVQYFLENTGTDDMTNLEFVHAIDPDQDATGCTGTSSSYNTYNSIEDVDGDGSDDMTQSVGIYSGWTIGFYGCQSGDEYGHNAGWEREADLTLTDDADASGDSAMYWRHSEATIAAGDSVDFAFLITMADSETSAQSSVLAEVDACDICDADGDGALAEICGGDDCDDDDSAAYPDNDEYCGDSIDNDCDGSTDEDDAIDTSTWYEDGDGDGYGTSDSSTTACDAPSDYVSDDTDCDDSDSNTHPGAAENDSSTDCMTDSDGDGYGDSGATGDVVAGTDCDDSDSGINPGASESVADGVDQDCDDEELCYTDDDGDGYGDSDTVASTDLDCSDSGEASDSSDCDDDDATVYDGATELCDGLDNDCDGTVPSDETDDDGDGYVECTEDSDGWDGDAAVTGFEDCNDAAASAYPGADEYCDGIDNDCDDEIDEDDAVDASTWYADNDSDGYGDPALSDVECEQPSDYVSDSSDCDDNDVGSYPGAPETPYDGIDQDCDGSDWCDVDGDGFLSDECPDGDDCDDSDAEINPDAEDAWYDDIDSNCDGASDYDADGDGYDSATYGGEDCDDADAETYPGAPDEPYDGVITDCDGADEYDQDGDGFDGGEDGTDCDDANSAVNPAADEIWYDGVDDDCDGNDDDQDLDGYGVDDDCDDLDAGVWDDCGEGDSGLSGDTGIGGTYKGGACSGCASGAPVGGLALLGLLGLAVVRRRRD